MTWQVSRRPLFVILNRDESVETDTHPSSSSLNGRVDCSYSCSLELNYRPAVPTNVYIYIDYLSFHPQSYDSKATPMEHLTTDKLFFGLWRSSLSAASSSPSSPSSTWIHRFWHRCIFLWGVVHEQCVQIQTFGQQPGSHRGPSHRKRGIRCRVFPAPASAIRVFQTEGDS